VDPKLLYWTAAFVNMSVLTGLALAGVRHARRGEVARHRRAMRIAAALVGLFLVSYPLKLLLLGREDMHDWSTAAIWVLRLHELCVLIMLVGGGLALVRGLRLARTRALLDDPSAPEPSLAALAAHRRAGRIALPAAALAWLSAAGVWAGMLARAS
jgi:uncharacterized membrane protein YozB (DUF420 family)